MISRLEIRLKQGLMDAEGTGIRRKAKTYFGIEVDDIRVIRVLTIDAALTPEQLEQVRFEIFTNPIIEESSFSPMASEFDWLIWIGFRPGVRDTAGSTAVEAIGDLLGIELGPDETVYTSKLYEIKGSISENQVNEIAGELLANDIIQQWKIFSPENWHRDEGIGFPVPKVILDHEPQVSTISIKSDEELKKISLERNLALQDRDVPVIREYFSREDVLKDRQKVGLDLPTDVELEYISQARSDHCNHNTFRGLFRYRDLENGHQETVNSLFKTCIEAPTLALKDRKEWGGDRRYH